MHCCVTPLNDHPKDLASNISREVYKLELLLFTSEVYVYKSHINEEYCLLVCDAMYFVKS
jgi:hypothetical protein